MKLYSRVFRNTSLLLSIAAVSAPPALAALRLLDRTLVVVNDDVILESDVAKFEKKLRSKSFQELFGGVDEKTMKNPEAVLQLMIEEKLINQQVKKLDLQASDQEVDGQIRAILRRNGITQAQLNERLKQLGTTVEDYREGIRRQIERKNLIEREIKPNMEITDEQLRNFYARTAKPSDVQTQYEIAHILIEKGKGDLSVLDRAKKVDGEVSVHPENFATFAKEYSDDTSTADNGGVLGWFSLNQLNQEFRRIVPETPPATVTGPIKLSDGYHIVKVLGTRKGDFTTLSKEQKDALRSQLVASEVERKMALWLERKKAESYIKRVIK